MTRFKTTYSRSLLSGQLVGFSKPIEERVTNCACGGPSADPLPLPQLTANEQQTLNALASEPLVPSGYDEWSADVTYNNCRSQSYAGAAPIVGNAAAREPYDLLPMPEQLDFASIVNQSYAGAAGGAPTAQRAEPLPMPSNPFLTDNGWPPQPAPEQHNPKPVQVPHSLVNNELPILRLPAI